MRANPGEQISPLKVMGQKDLVQRYWQQQKRLAA